MARAQTTKTTRGKAAPPPRQVAPKRPTKAVAKANSGAPAIYDYGAQAGAGAEDIGPEDFLLPFARIADPKSPQVQKRAEQYIPGLQPGQFFNITTGRVYGDPEDDEAGFPFIAHLCAKQRGYAEFIPREDDGLGGGFVAQHPADYELALELRAKQGQFGKLETEAGTELMETHYLFLIVPPDDAHPDSEPIVIPAASTHITPVKQLMMKLNPLLRRGVPIFAPRLVVSTRYRQRPGQAWFVPNFELDGAAPAEYLLPPGDPLLAVCAELREAALAGRARADYEQQAGALADDDNEVPL